MVRKSKRGTRYTPAQKAKILALSGGGEVLP